MKLRNIALVLAIAATGTAFAETTVIRDGRDANQHRMDRRAEVYREMHRPRHYAYVNPYVRHHRRVVVIPG
jgi:hypothetical protein